MYMETQANLDYWSTDNCCIKVSLRTGTIIIALISMVLQLLTGAAVVMIGLECLDDIKSNCTFLGDDSSQSLNINLNQNRSSIPNEEGCLSGGMSVVLCQFPFWHEGRLYMSHDNTNDTRKVASLCNTEHLACEPSNANHNEYTNCIQICQEHGSCDTVVCPENMYCKENPSPACECITGFNSQESTCIKDMKSNVTEHESCDTVVCLENMHCTENPSPACECITGFNSQDSTCVKDMKYNVTEHESCDTVVCPENMHCTENPSPACECNTGFTSQESTCVKDIKYNTTGLEPCGSLGVNLLQCPWMPEPEREFFHSFSQNTLYFLTGLLLAYLSTYLILSICTLVGTITYKENLLTGWVFCTWLHMGFILIDLLFTLHLTTAVHLISSVAYFVYSLYTWAVVKSNMHAIKVEKNKKPFIEGIITSYSIDGIDIRELTAEMTEMSEI